MGAGVIYFHIELLSRDLHSSRATVQNLTSEFPNSKGIFEAKIFDRANVFLSVLDMKSHYHVITFRAA